MAFQDCIDEITRAAGRQLTDDELDDLLTELQARIAQRQRARQGEAFDEAVTGAADDLAQDMAAAAVIEKRNAAINLRRRLEALDFVRTQFPNDPATGIQSLLVGSNLVRKGSRNSAAAEQNALKDYYLGGFIADVEKRNLWPVFTSGTMDREISRALWALDQDLQPGGPRQAREIAEVIRKWQELARQDANRAGAWIKKRPGYIVRQSHDMYKVARAGFEDWRDFILPKLDAEETFGSTVPEDFLREAYNGLASGIHLKTTTVTPSGFKGPRNLAKKASAERVLHFRNADDWFDYNQRFGTGSLREALLRGFEVNAHATGLMRVMGTNPEDTFNRVTGELMKGLSDPNARRAFADATGGRLKGQLMELDGTARSAVSHTGAAVASNLRILQRTAKLGAALLSQIGDIPLYASEMRYQGGNMLSGIGESIGNMLRGRGTAERRELGGMLGVISDLMSGEITARFSIADDDVPGMMTRVQQKFFKWNGMSWWTDSQRRGAIFGMSWRLAHHSGKSWGQVPEDLRRTLNLFAINEPEWNVIRQARTRQADGRNYVVPEAIEELPDEVFTPLLGGRNPTPNRIATLKREVADKLRKYFTDRASFATIMPDQRTRAMMQRGTRPGSVEGEFMRFIGELKAFPVSVIQKSVGREIYGRGSDTLSQALRGGNGEMVGLANLILWTTAFGYIAMSAKDLVKGRNPRDPANYKTWLSSATQGGGLGIYGDFLFGEVRNRFGGGLLTTLAGPTLGAGQDLADLWGRVRNGDDAAAASFRLMLSNTPFANVFYTKVALDYLILWQIQEWLNPGAMKRRERTIERENAQTFWLPPSQAVR